MPQSQNMETFKCIWRGALHWTSIIDNRIAYLCIVWHDTQTNKRTNKQTNKWTKIKLRFDADCRVAMQIVMRMKWRTSRAHTTTSEWISFSTFYYYYRVSTCWNVANWQCGKLLLFFFFFCFCHSKSGAVRQRSVQIESNLAAWHGYLIDFTHYCVLIEWHRIFDIRSIWWHSPNMHSKMNTNIFRRQNDQFSQLSTVVTRYEEGMIFVLCRDVNIDKKSKAMALWSDISLFSYFRLDNCRYLCCRWANNS